MRMAKLNLLFQAVVFSIAISTARSTNTTENSAPPLPNINDSFETVRRGHKVYVDKTSILAKLLNEGARSFYVTRPRKFGKTMFLRMVQKFFLGEADLFENLTIHADGNVKNILEGQRTEKWIKYPVVYLDFSASEYRDLSAFADFRLKLDLELKTIAASYDVQVSAKYVEIDILAEALHKKLNLPVIILIDDFDAPIHHAFLDKNRKLAIDIHGFFLNMFADIKAAREKDIVELVFVTGVSRFGIYANNKGAKNFVDLTDHDEFATALGFTPDEVKTNFGSDVDRFAANANTTREDIMKELLEWYGGYRFSSQERFLVLSPISTIKCLQEERFDSFWCAANSIHHVLNTFDAQKIGLDHFERMRVKRWTLLDMYEAAYEEPPFHVYLLCTGFLTVKTYLREIDTCELGYPNKEVEQFLEDRLSGWVASRNKSISELVNWNGAVSNAMRDQNIPLLMRTLKFYGFPILYSKRGPRSPTREREVTRRLVRIFDAASIEYRLGTQEDGLVDVQTVGLPMNYVIKTTCQKGVVEVILEFISRVRDGSDSFGRAIFNRTEVYLTGMSFTNQSRGQLEDWICLPYRHGEMKFDEVQASKVDLVDKLNEHTRKTES